MISELPKRLDGNVNMWALSYLAIAQPLAGYIHTSSAFMVKVSDIGTGRLIVLPSNDPPPNLL
jgi:hypothetical protein